MKNVTLVTNMWGRGTHEQEMAQEQQLQWELFKPALEQGARMFRHEDTPESARDILGVILNNRGLSLRIQDELVNQGKRLADTEAWKELDKERHNKEIGQLEKRMQAMGREKEELRGELDKEKEDSRGMAEEIGRLQESIQAMGREKGELRGELDKEKGNSRVMMEKHDKEIERLERGMRAMEELRGELDKGKKNLEKEVKRLEGFVVEMQARDKEEEELRRELDEENRSLEEEVKRLEGSVAEMWAEIQRERQNKKGWGLIGQFGWGAGGGATDKIPYGVEREGRGSGEASRTRRRVVSVRRTFDRLNRSSADFGDKLNEVLHKPEYEEWVSTLEKNELMWLIDYLDTVSRPCIPP